MNSIGVNAPFGTVGLDNGSMGYVGMGTTKSAGPGPAAGTDTSAATGSGNAATAAAAGGYSANGAWYGPQAGPGGASGGYWANGVWYGPSYAAGTPYVPRTGLALIHKGEKITPADQNAQGGPAAGSISITGGIQFVLPNVTDRSTANDLVDQAWPKLMQKIEQYQSRRKRAA
jgi:hypothetical protein